MLFLFVFQAIFLYFNDPLYPFFVISLGSIFSLTSYFFDFLKFWVRFFSYQVLPIYNRTTQNLYTVYINIYILLFMIFIF